jgi:hypothetical protein
MDLIAKIVTYPLLAGAVVMGGAIAHGAITSTMNPAPVEQVALDDAPCFGIEGEVFDRCRVHDAEVAANNEAWLADAAAGRPHYTRYIYVLPASSDNFYSDGPQCFANYYGEC